MYNVNIQFNPPDPLVEMMMNLWKIHNKNKHLINKTINKKKVKENSVDLISCFSKINAHFYINI